MEKAALQNPTCPGSECLPGRGLLSADSLLWLIGSCILWRHPAAFEGPSVMCPEFASNEDLLLVPGRGVRLGTCGLYRLPFCYFNTSVMWR